MLDFYTLKILQTFFSCTMITWGTFPKELDCRVHLLNFLVCCKALQSINLPKGRIFSSWYHQHALYHRTARKEWQLVCCPLLSPQITFYSVVWHWWKQTF